jgi:hypothetical protein
MRERGGWIGLLMPWLNLVRSGLVSQEKSKLDRLKRLGLHSVLPCVIQCADTLTSPLVTRSLPC